MNEENVSLSKLYLYCLTQGTAGYQNLYECVDPSMPSLQIYHHEP
jgi:hypothetical protein